MKSILVVDDDKIVLEEICSCLSSYRVFQAGTGQSALEIAKLVKPDLILLDIIMPGMDGFSVLDQLQNNPHLLHIPVIFLTGDDSPELQVKGLKSGVVDFILKPVDRKILNHRVELHLKLGEYRLTLEHSASELENNIGLSFAELIECKDFNFSGHVMRTERYTELLALTLHNAGLFPEILSLSYIDDLCRAVPFHDIGKIGISDEILCKQGRLTDAELMIARAHTTIGAKILDDIHDQIPDKSYFKTASLIARSHHERFDGKGYPDGLSGDIIPLCCRIVSVVNVYDACTSERVYHPPMKHEEACAELDKGKGSEFDPKIVDVFLRNNNEFLQLGERLTVVTNSWRKSPSVKMLPAEMQTELYL